MPTAEAMQISWKLTAHMGQFPASWKLAVTFWKVCQPLSLASSLLWLNAWEVTKLSMWRVSNGSAFPWTSPRCLSVLKQFCFGNKQPNSRSLPDTRTGWPGECRLDSAEERGYDARSDGCLASSRRWKKGKQFCSRLYWFTERRHLQKC